MKQAFILGPPRTATTSLFVYLVDHPDIVGSRLKETRFFELEWDEGLDHYLDEHYPKDRQGEVRLEGSPYNLVLPFITERIHKAFPEAKLIVTLRDPVERAFSEWWFLYSRQVERLPFSEAIEANLQQIDWDDPLRHLRDPERWRRNVRSILEDRTIQTRTYVEGGMYDRHLERYLEVFADEQVMVVPMEHIMDTPMQTIRELWGFLGVDPGQPIGELEKANVAFGQLPSWLLSGIRMANDLGISSRLPDTVKGLLRRLLSAVGQKPTIPDDAEDRLREVYRDITGWERLRDRHSLVWTQG